MSDIVVDIQQMKNYACAIQQTNNRLENLDWRLKSLYSQIGLQGLWDLLQADLLTGRSETLRRCRNYLDRTADDFEKLENELKRYDPLDFKKPPELGENLAEYLRDHMAGHVFASYSFSQYFINDVDALTVFGYFLSKTKDDVKSMFNAVGKKGKYAENVANEFMNDEENVKEILSGVIEEMMKNRFKKVYDASPVKALEALDKLTDPELSEELRDCLDEVYSDNKAVGKIGKYAEKITYLLTDYSENVDMLRSIRGIAPNNQTLNKVIDELILDYTHKFEVLVRDEVVDKVEEFAEKNIDAILGTNFGLVNKVLEGTIGKLPSMDAMDTVIHISTLKSGANYAYQVAVQKIQSGTYTEEDLQAYIHSFELSRALTLKEYQAMLKYYDNPYSEEHMYLKNQISALENMQYDDLEKATPFSEYKRSGGDGHGGRMSSGGGFGGGGGGGGIF